RESRLGGGSKGEPKGQDLVASQPVEDVRPPALGLHEPGALEHLKVPGRVGDRQAGLAGEGIDAAWCLSEQIQQLEPLLAGERRADAGELAVDPVLELAMGHRRGSYLSRPPSSTDQLIT